MALNINVIATNETVTGASDGTIYIQAFNDNISIIADEYYVNGFAGGQTSPNFYGLSAGVYTCQFRAGLEYSPIQHVPISTASPTPDPNPPTPPVPIVYEYRSRYQGSFCDKRGQNIIVTFKKRYPVDSIIIPVQEIQFAGESDSPVLIDYPDNGEYKLTPVNGSQCEVRIKAIGDFELSSMYTADEKEWRVDISGSWKWSGYLIPDSCIEPFASKPYDVSVRATDALGLLKDVPFQREDLTKYKGYYSDREVLRLCLAKTGLSLNMLVGVNTYEATMVINDPVSPMGQSFINTEPFLNEDGTAIDCYTIMESILSRWGCRLHQFNGVWQIVNVMEKSLDDVSAFQFNPDGFTNGLSITLGNFVRVGGQNRRIRPVGDTSFAKAFKQSEAYYKYGYIANTLFNGDFDKWTSKPNGLPDGWSMNGGTTGTTLTRYQNGYETSDYYIEIGVNGTGGIIHDTPVQIRQYDFPTISFDLLTETGSYGFSRDRYISVFISNGDGMWFTSDGWKNTNQAYVIKKDGGDFLKQQKIEIKVDPLDDDYLMTINILAVGVVSGLHFKTYINNVVINAGSGLSRTKNSIGESNLQELLTKQTFKPDRIELLHSDDSNNTRTSGIRISQSENSPLIIPDSAQFSSLWKRAGITEYFPILSLIANTELRLHQKAYRIVDFEYVTDWQSDTVEVIDINTLLAVDLLDSYFIFLSGSFDLKSGIPRLKFAQVLTEAVMVNETLKMDYGDS